MHHSGPEYNDRFGTHVNRRTVLYSRTYWIRTMCSHDMYQVSNILYHTYDTTTAATPVLEAIHRVSLLLAAVIRLHQTGPRECELRVVIYLLLLPETFGEFGGGAFWLCFNQILCEIRFGHGDGVFLIS